MYWKEPKTEQEALNIFWNANIVNITRIVKLKCQEDCNVTDFLEEIISEAPPVYEDPEFDIEEFYKKEKKAIAHYTRVETGMKPKYWTLAVTEVDGEMIHAAFINGGDNEEEDNSNALSNKLSTVASATMKELKKEHKEDNDGEEDGEGKEVSMEEFADALNEKLEGTGVHVAVVENKPEMTKLRAKAIEEVKAVFEEMTKLYELGSFPTIGVIADLIFKDNWSLGALNCPSLPDDKKYAEKSLTKVFKVFSENILLTQVMLPIEESMEEYNAANFIDALFGMDPMIGINMGTSLVELNNEFHTNVCRSLIEYARRYMDE